MPASSPSCQPSASALGELRLDGGDFLDCVSSVRALAKKRPARRLWGSGKGRYKTRGRYSSATVRGTKWLTEDLCDGTRITVVEGTVVVRDFVRNRDVTVHAGHSYRAEALPRERPKCGLHRRRHEPARLPAGDCRPRRHLRPRRRRRPDRPGRKRPADRRARQRPASRRRGRRRPARERGQGLPQGQHRSRRARGRRRERLHGRARRRPRKRSSHGRRRTRSLLHRLGQGLPLSLAS